MASESLLFFREGEHERLVAGSRIRFMPSEVEIELTIRDSRYVLTEWGSSQEGASLSQEGYRLPNPPAASSGCAIHACVYERG